MARSANRFGSLPLNGAKLSELGKDVAWKNCLDSGQFSCRGRLSPGWFLENRWIPAIFFLTLLNPAELLCRIVRQG
jgi:hypothetical protein